jgi:hypothetical protein
MTHSYVPFTPEGTTLEEFRKLLELRLLALADATRQAGLGEPLPVSWRHGWKAHIRIQERDADGSLKAHIVVTGPRGEVPYVRKVRLVASRPLPWMQGRG